MENIKKIAGLAGIVTILAAIPAHSQQNLLQCIDRGEALTHLEKEYGETVIARGLASDGGVVEVIVNKDGSTWSIVITRPDGTSCLVASGEHWEEVERSANGTKT